MLTYGTLEDIHGHSRGDEKRYRQVQSLYEGSTVHAACFKTSMSGLGCDRYGDKGYQYNLFVIHTTSSGEVCLDYLDEEGWFEDKDTGCYYNGWRYTFSDTITPGDIMDSVEDPSSYYWDTKMLKLEGCQRKEIDLC